MANRTTELRPMGERPTSIADVQAKLAAGAYEASATELAELIIGWHYAERLVAA